MQDTRQLALFPLMKSHICLSRLIQVIFIKLFKNIMNMLRRKGLIYFCFFIFILIILFTYYILYVNIIIIHVIATIFSCKTFYTHILL